MSDVSNDLYFGGLGIDPVGAEREPDPDNEIVDRMMRGGEMPQTDKDGRMIISFRQYQELHSRKARLDQYSLRMFFPGKRGVYRIQASKYLKWLRYGYRAVGDEPDKTEKVVRTTAVPQDGNDHDSAANPTIFFCSDKYPDCRRFFDTAKGLEFHWRNDHLKALKPRTSRARKPVASSATPIETSLDTDSE